MRTSGTRNRCVRAVTCGLTPLDPAVSPKDPTVGPPLGWTANDAQSYSSAVSNVHERETFPRASLNTPPPHELLPSGIGTMTYSP